MTTAAEAMPLADYLISKGIEPAQAAVLGAQGDEISRNRGQGIRVSETGQPIEPHQVPQPLPPPARVATQAEATSALRAHEESVQAAHLDQHFAPPPDASFYQFPHSLAPETEDAIAADRELRTAFHAEGLPRHVVESIGAELANAAARNETDEQVQARIASTRTTLERWYGKDTDSNLKLVDGILDRLLAKGGPVADFVANAVPHLDALSIDSLVQWARHRASRR